MFSPFLSCLVHSDIWECASDAALIYPGGTWEPGMIPPFRIAVVLWLSDETPGPAIKR